MKQYLAVDIGGTSMKYAAVDDRGELRRLGTVPTGSGMTRAGLETALLPTLNSMVGMGIVSLPGMMTGQILSGTMPTTAILYQIAVMIAICTVVTAASFGSLFLGLRTLYDPKNQIL